MTIDILFPVLNEHLRLERGIERFMDFAKENIKVPYNVVIIDNGSDDDTPEIGRLLDDKYECVKYVRLDERGVGIAFKYGIELTDSDIVGYMDIDLSTDLNSLVEAIDLFEKNNEIEYINGTRFHKKSNTIGRKWYRKFISKVLLIILKFGLNMRATDALCGFTFLRSEIAKKLIKECSDDRGWFYTVEFLLRAERMGVGIYDMPVTWRDDYDTTVNIRKTTANYLKRIVALRKMFRIERKKR